MMEIQRAKRPSQPDAIPPKAPIASREETASDATLSRAEGISGIEHAPSDRSASVQQLNGDVTLRKAEPRSAGSVVGALVDRQVQEKTKQLRARLESRSAAGITSGALGTPSGRKHAVAPGETLLDIAQKHGASLLQFISVNRGTDLAKLQPGQQLEIPEVRVAARSRLDSENACRDVADYTVKPGDSLWKIAECELGDANRWPEIYERNRAAIDVAAQKHGAKPDPSTGYAHWIFPGEQFSLCLPAGATQVESPTALLSGSTSVVGTADPLSRGESADVRTYLGTVAKEKGIQVQEPGWISKDDLHKLIPYAVGALAAAGLLYGLNKAAQARLATKVIQELAKVAGTAISLDKIAETMSRLIKDELGGAPGSNSEQSDSKADKASSDPENKQDSSLPPGTPSDGPPSRKQRMPSTDPRPPGKVSQTGYTTVDVQPPQGGPPIRCAQRGSAQVPFDKVEKYGAGKTQAYPEQEHRELKHLKQTRRKEFDSDPRNKARLKKLVDLQHNHNRSQAMAQVMRDVGLNPDSKTDLQKITEHLLDVGQHVNDQNFKDFPSEISTPAGKLKILSNWKRTDEGKWYLSTIRYVPKVGE
jgi:nucleoid-associated protein YgaU